MCPRCGSRDLYGDIITYKTGVVAPDGTPEWVSEDVIICRSCHLKFRPQDEATYEGLNKE